MYEQHWLFETPLAYSSSSNYSRLDIESPDFMSKIAGGGQPIQVKWTDPKPFPIFDQYPAAGIVPKEAKGTFAIYRNGRAIYVGGGGVDRVRRGGSIYQELTQYARCLRIVASKADRFTVRVGVLTSSATPQRVKIVEISSIQDTNKQLRQQKKRLLANKRDLNLQLKKEAKIIHTGSLPPHLNRNKSSSTFTQTLHPTRKSREAEVQWLFEVPFA
jgi:hypothetical protein